MKEALPVILCLLFFTTLCPRALSGQGVRKSYQVPAEVYVGDTGKLVYPLDEFFLNIQTPKAVWDNEGSDVLIVDVEFDRSGKALVISFLAWQAGLLTLPTLVIGGEELSGVQVRVNSVLAKKDVSLVLLPQEGPLNPPGTFWLLLLGSLALVAGILTLLAGGMYGKSAYKTFAEKLRLSMPRRRMRGCIKSLTKKLNKGKLTAEGFLAGLCREFRSFVDVLYNVECAALTSYEFNDLNVEGSARLAELLCAADNLRFSGKEIPPPTALDFARTLAGEVEERCKPPDA